MDFLVRKNSGSVQKPQKAPPCHAAWCSLTSFLLQRPPAAGLHWAQIHCNIVVIYCNRVVIQCNRVAQKMNQCLDTLQHGCITLQHGCNTLQVHHVCNMLQHDCNTLQVHHGCNALQHGCTTNAPWSRYTASRAQYSAPRLQNCARSYDKGTADIKVYIRMQNTGV